MERTFTYDEASTLLPVLESLLRRALTAKATLEAADNSFQELSAKIMVSGGLLVDIARAARRRAERDKAAQDLKDSFAEIESIGVQVKDLDIGLLDFPCNVGDRTILLCWKMGEKSITHWHGMEEGFRGRKPVDQTITHPRKQNRPN